MRVPYLSMRGIVVFVLAVALLAVGCRREPTAADGVSTLQRAFPDIGAAPVVQLAIAAAQTNELGQGVIALQDAKHVPGLSAGQLQAVEQASQVLTRELLRRAEAGDARAKADLDLIERSRSQ